MTMFLSISYDYVFEYFSSYSKEAATRGVFLKKVFLKISQKNTFVGVSFLIKLQLQLYQKETPTQVFSCEICDIFKSTYLEEHLQTTAFGRTLVP